MGADRTNDHLPLEVEKLSFRYKLRPEPAIEEISFGLRPGEMLLIAGASGCGKTTVARCINGLIPRSYKGELSGAVRLYGQDINAMSLAEISQTVGTLLQDPERQIVGSNVRAEIAFGPENLGLPRDEIEARIDEVLQRLGIEHLRGRETFVLSGGEKQKVALAGILAMRPSILILDEPLASLDPTSAHEALTIFRRLADEGSTVVIVEHRVEDVLGIQPDLLMYMQEGRVHYLGQAADMPSALDHHEVKLPAQWVIRRIRETGETPAEPPPIPMADPASEPLVRFEGVSFAYGDGPLVLRDIDLEIREGDTIAVLGPNGAGKSTLVKHAIGLLKPVEGRVLMAGQDTRQLSIAQAAGTVGYVFQSPSHMLFAPSVREELSFGPRNLRFPEETIKTSVERSIEAVNLRGLEDYSPLSLSFGQQKRTAIASVLAMRSKILILDEPTAGQDYANYTRFMDAMAGASLEGGRSVLGTHFAATLFITHDVDLAVTYANRIVLLSEGRLVADGPPDSVLCQFDLLRSCRVRPTSLLELNCEMIGQTGRFLPAPALAGYV